MIVNNVNCVISFVTYKYRKRPCMKFKCAVIKSSDHPPAVGLRQKSYLLNHIRKNSNLCKEYEIVTFLKQTCS